MQCHYGCCTYEEKPYPTGMVINRYHEPTAEDDRTIIPNVRYRVPVIQVPEITSTIRWSGGAMVLGKLPVPGRPTVLITVGQGPTALAVGAGGGCLDIFILIYPFSPLSPSLWETA